MAGLINEDSFKTFLESFNNQLNTDGIASGRAVVVYTGIRGAQMIHHTYEVTNALDMLDWLFMKKSITLAEKESLSKMLTSSDYENFNVAIELIKIRQFKAINNGTKI